MLNLKRYAKMATEQVVTDKNREVFKTAGFDPEELVQVKEMNTKELQSLMLFCGIRAFNGVPLLVMEDDEMRMAYVVWRSQKVAERKKEIATKMEGVMKWSNRLLDAAKVWGNSI
jgi:hypothetical protein